MKKALFYLLALAMFLSLTACGGNTDSSPAEPSGEIPAETPAPTAEPAPSPTVEPERSGYAATRTGRFKDRFLSGAMTAEYRTQYSNVSFSCFHAIKDGREYLKMEYDGQAPTIGIIDGDSYYLVDHGQKLVVTAPRDSGGAGLSNINAAFNIPEESEVDMADFKTGSMDVDGRLCDTEEWLVNGEPVTLCFDGEELVRVIAVINGYEQITTIHSISTEAADDSLFVLPQDYHYIKLEDIFAALE